MIVNFLKTKRKKKELKIALDVIEEFKDNENVEEWYSIPFMAWAKLEQLVEYLEHLVHNKPLREDTLRQLK